jgi:hypothetical protein
MADRKTPAARFLQTLTSGAIFWLSLNPALAETTYVPKGFLEGKWGPEGYSYSLPYSPFTSVCPGAGTSDCRGDRDRDGLLDAAEHELARVAAPVIVFDEWERHARGLVPVFQAHPTKALFAGCAPVYIEVLYKIVFLYRKDATHPGDTQTIKAWLGSFDGGRRWQLVRAAWTHGRRICWYCRLLCWRHDPASWTSLFWDLALQGRNALKWADLRGSGRGRHHLVFPSEGKHRNYRDKQTCERTFHGTRWDPEKKRHVSCEDCGGGSRVLAIFGARLRGPKRHRRRAYSFDTAALGALAPARLIYRANLGEPRRRLLQGRPYFHIGRDLGFPGEDYDHRWCGGIKAPDRSVCASPVAWKMRRPPRVLPLRCGRSRSFRRSRLRSPGRSLPAPHPSP